MEDINSKIASEKGDPPLLPKDPLMNDSVRFNIVYLLYNFESLGFTPLQKVLKITSGNLDHHLKKLLAAGVVNDSIRFSPRPLKILRLTPKGKKMFNDHIKNLKQMIDPL
jgi:DNA-binding MarR family transcriptional regulator